MYLGLTLLHGERFSQLGRSVEDERKREPGAAAV
jgi:hypothetical protein